MAADHVTDRAPFRFAEEVQKCFAFLDGHEFHCVRAEETLVRFESSKLAINVYYGRQSYEIGLDLEFPQSTDTYSISEILRLVDGKQAAQYRNFATHTVDGVATGVRQLAELFRKWLDAGLLNEGRLLARLNSQRGQLTGEYAVEIQLEQARKQSEAAWKSRDFVRVVKILAPLQECLGPVDLNKLEYSRKYQHT